MDSRPGRGSPEAEAAARKVADLARAFEANLLLVYVVPSRLRPSAESVADRLVQICPRPVLVVR
jgi:nucleotide-binding universal stress UspA family protein